MLSGVASDLTSPVRSNSLQDLKTLDRGVRLDRLLFHRGDSARLN